MNLAKAFGGGHPSSTLGMLQSWESQEGAHTPSGSKTPIVICGWLLKMKREHRKFRSTWNRRWFTVEDGAFHWYKTSSSDACGRLSLVDISSVRKVEGAGPGNFSFILHATNRDMLLRADSANDESRWVRGLTLQIDLVHGGTFQGPPSVKNRRRTVSMGEGVGPGGCGGTPGRRRSGQQGEWEGSHFREINDRIREIMDERGGGPAGGAQGAHGSSGTRSASTSISPARTVKITPRDPRGISIGTGRRLAQLSEAGVAGLEESGGVGGPEGGWKRWTARIVPISSPRRSRSPECKGEGRIGDGVGDRKSQPPVPRGPPPVNGRGRPGSSRSSNASAGGRRQDVLDIADGSDSEEDFDYRWGRQGGDGDRVRVSPADSAGHRTPRQRRQQSNARRDEGVHGGGGAGAGHRREGGRAEPVQTAARGKGKARARPEQQQQQQQQQLTRFDDLEDYSSDQSTRTRDDPFMADCVTIDSARSSASSQRESETNSSRSPTQHTRRRHSHGGDGSTGDGRACGQRRRATHERLPGPSPSLSPTAAPDRRWDTKNFDDDESDEEETPVVKTKDWLRNGYSGIRDSSSGSVTAENSWSSAGMGKGCDDETPSTSLLGSSGRSSSRSGFRPSRRYLVEQNKLRQQGW